MKVAFVYDRINTFGGAERVLIALHALWPDAPLYTSVYDSKGAVWAKNIDIRTSFLQFIPFASRNHRALGWIMPLAFESLDLTGYDVVISVSSEAAKNVITRSGQIHICYCLTPTRYLWNLQQEYENRPMLGRFSMIAQFGLKMCGNLMRSWDFIASYRPDYYVAISDRVAERVQLYYHQDPIETIYPPVNTTLFEQKAAVTQRGYFLCIARLVGYKRIDVIVDAANRMKMPLIIIGRGPAYKELKHKAGNTIEFITKHLTDLELASYYQNCQAVISCADEDFGINMVEAQAAGRPVISYRYSAGSEIVNEGVTGILFDEQKAASLVEALERFQTFKYTETLCRENASKFSVSNFQKKIYRLVTRLTQKEVVT